MIDSNKRTARFTRNSALRNNDEEFELLLTHKKSDHKVKGSSAKTRLLFHTSMLLIGLTGSISCLWSMFYTSESEEVAISLGLHRVANSLENILSLLAYPVLMFMVILTLYAGQQLYRLYKDVTTLKSNRLCRHR